MSQIFKDYFYLPFFLLNYFMVWGTWIYEKNQGVNTGEETFVIEPLVKKS